MRAVRLTALSLLALAVAACATVRAPARGLRIDPAALAVAPPAGGDELCAGVGVAVHAPFDERLLQAAAAAGIHWLRTDLFWGEVERVPGRYDFAAWDALVAFAEARRLEVLFILDYDNPLHADGPRYSPQSPATVATFGDFAAAAARHFAGRPVAYEIWNEPNLGFWVPAPDASQYAQLFREAARRIHAVSTRLRVATGGVFGLDFGFLRALARDGVFAVADAVGVHPYVAGPPEALAADVATLRAALGAAPPLWDTEAGYSAATARDLAAARLRQAWLVTRQLVVARALGFALAIVYDLVDDGSVATEREHNFGLFAADGTEKPLLQALRTLSSFARPRRFAGLQPAGRDDLHVARFDGDGDVVLMFWTSTPGREVELSFARPPRALVDALGRALPLASRATASNAPSYALFRP